MSTEVSNSEVAVLWTLERMDCVIRPCFDSVSTKFLSSSLMPVSWSILAWSEEKIVGSMLGEVAATFAMAVSPDMVFEQEISFTRGPHNLRRRNVCVQAGELGLFAPSFVLTLSLVISSIGFVRLDIELRRIGCKLRIILYIYEYDRELGILGMPILGVGYYGMKLLGHSTG